QSLPMLIHASQLVPPSRRQPVVLPRRPVRGFFDVRLHVVFVSQPAENWIDRSLRDDESVDIGETPDDVVSIKRSRPERIQNRELEQSLAKLRRPVVVEGGAHVPCNIVPRQLPVNAM